MTKNEALTLARDWIAERPADRSVSAGKMISIIDRALTQPEQYTDIVSDGGLDPRNKFDAQPEQEPVGFASLLREAEEILQSKPTWKRFIDGTPLVNDIAVWMTVFAQDVVRRTSPPQRPWVGLTDEDKQNFAAAQHGWEDLLTAAEAKLKEKNA